MTLGALVVLAVLVVAGIYVPRSSRTEAKSAEAMSAGDLSSNSSKPVDSQNCGAGPATGPDRQERARRNRLPRQGRP